jgi:hypothetical protein
MSCRDPKELLAYRSAEDLYEKVLCEKRNKVKKIKQESNKQN